MTAIALQSEFRRPAAPRRSATHRLALALVWLAVVAGAMVFTEPAPVDVLTMGLVVLLPVIGLVAISRALIGMLALMLTAAAAAFVAAIDSVDFAASITHTSVSLYLYLATFVFAAFVAKRPAVHARLILDAYVWAAAIAAVAGIAGYFDLVPGAFDLMTRYGRATGMFKDPNVFGPFLVPAFVYVLSRLATGRLRGALPSLVLLLVLGLAVLLSFSRGAWMNLGIAVVLYGALHILTARTDWARLKIATLALVGLAAFGMLVVAALQFDAIANLFAERAALTQSYDVGPEGRFGGQEKAVRLAIDNPFGIGAQQFVPHYHHEEPHNVYLAMFLNAGWVGGLIFIAIVATAAAQGLRHAFARTATQPLFLVAYACFIGHALEGALIDLDHWRHFYLLLALVWGLMLAPRSERAIAYRPAA